MASCIPDTCAGGRAAGRDSAVCAAEDSGSQRIWHHLWTNSGQGTVHSRIFCRRRCSSARDRCSWRDVAAALGAASAPSVLPVVALAPFNVRHALRRVNFCCAMRCRLSVICCALVRRSPLTASQVGSSLCAGYSFWTMGVACWRLIGVRHSVCLC